MITKTNEKIVYNASMTEADYTIKATVVTSMDSELMSLEGGSIMVDSQNIADFSVAQNNYAYLNCYSRNNLVMAATAIADFINYLRNNNDEN